MDNINVRYGEDITLPIDADDVNAVSATLFVGNPGQLPKITVPATLTDGVGAFDFKVEIPLGTYKYQINVINEAGKTEKYPDPDYCEDCTENDFPLFTVAEALDETEVVS